MGTLQKGIAGALAALVLAGCSEGVGPTSATEEAVDDDVALLVAQATIDDVADLWLARDLAGAAGTDAGPALQNDRRPDGERSRTVTIYDADGNVMDVYDPLLTASVVIVTDVSATRSGPRWEAAFERHREMTVTGLAGEETERTWNGTGSDEVARTRIDGARSYTMEAAVTVEDLVVGIPREEHPWPLSGTITRHVEIAVVNGPDGDRSFERTVVISFDGTQYATLTVDGETYVVDLADRDGHRPHRGGR